MELAGQCLRQGVTEGYALQAEERSVFDGPVRENGAADCGGPHSPAGVHRTELVKVVDKLAGGPVDVGPALVHVHHIEEVAVVVFPRGGELDLVGVVNLVADHIGEVGAEIDSLEVGAQRETSGKVRSGVADDLAVGDGDLSVTVQVLELDGAGTHVGGTDDAGVVGDTFPEDPLAVGVSGEVVRGVEAVIAVSVHVAERLADLDNVVVADLGRCPVGLGGDGLETAEVGDPVDVVGDVAVEVKGEVLGGDERSIDGEFDTPVAGRTYVLVLAVISGSGDGEIDEQVLGVVLVHLDASGQAALEEAEVESDIVRVCGLPGQVGIVHHLSGGEDVVSHGEPGRGGRRVGLHQLSRGDVVVTGSTEAVAELELVNPVGGFHPRLVGDGP